VADADDDEVLRRLRGGDEEAYATVVRRHGGHLLAVARRFLRNEEDARDAVQEAFRAAFRAIDRFEGGAKLSTWLHRIAVNAALMRLRSRKRRPETAIEDLLPAYREDGHHLDPPRPWAVAPDGDEAERNEVRELVRDAIDRLPDAYRNVVLLRDIEGIDTEETARLLETSPGAIKTRLHRARQALRTLLNPHFREDPE